MLLFISLRLVEQNICRPLALVHLFMREKLHYVRNSELNCTNKYGQQVEQNVLPISASSLPNSPSIWARNVCNLQKKRLTDRQAGREGGREVEVCAPTRQEAGNIIEILCNSKGQERQAKSAINQTEITLETQDNIALISYYGINKYL